MPRYIDADAIHYVEVGKGVEIALASDIDKMPTVSPDEVRGVGEWRNKVMAVPGGHGQTYSRWGCSVCKKKFKERSNYCPSCGARMKGVSEDAHKN